MNPTEWYSGYYQLKSGGTGLQRWSNLSQEMKELGIETFENCLTKEQAEDVLARANRCRSSGPESASFRTLGKPLTNSTIQNTSTQTTLAVVSKENMKLSISRVNLIAGLENYIKTETETFTTNTRAFNDSQAPITAFVASQRVRVASKNGVTEENVTPFMLSTAVQSISNSLGVPSTPPTAPNLSAVNTLLNKLSLATDETIELDACDPILNFFNASK